MEMAYWLNTNELGNDFINTLRDAYPDRDIEIMVREQDETEYLLRSPANRKRLLEAIENVNKGNIITFETLEDAMKTAEELNKKQ